MALWLKLMLGEQRIGYLVARRRPHHHNPGREDICTYDWTVEDNGSTRSNMEDDPLPHRYGDGAWGLVGRILETAGHYTPASTSPADDTDQGDPP